MSHDVTGGGDGSQADAAAIRDRVFGESERFRAALPTLLPLYPDKWVVFRDGEVHSVHETSEEAYVAALARFGPDGAFVIRAVRLLTCSSTAAGSPPAGSSCAWVSPRTPARQPVEPKVNPSGPWT